MKFEGEYKDDIRNEKRKIYYANGQLAFESEYINDIRNGEGKEYDVNGKY